MTQTGKGRGLEARGREKGLGSEWEGGGGRRREGRRGGMHVVKLASLTSGVRVLQFFLSIAFFFINTEVKAVKRKLYCRKGREKGRREAGEGRGW